MSDAFYRILNFRSHGSKRPQKVIQTIGDGSGLKRRADRLCDCLRGRWSGRYSGYVMSARKAALFEELWRSGRDGCSYTLKFDPPNAPLSIGAKLELEKAGIPLP